ncbi:hypothetical protein ACSSZE_15480 [Acidithiobacillus caldus]
MASVVLAALAIPALSLAGTIPAKVQPGFYVGPGDGAKVVLYVMPGGKARIGAFDTYSGMGYHAKPVTPKLVKKAGLNGWLSTYTYDPKTGELDVSTPVPAGPGMSANACIREYRAVSADAFKNVGERTAHGSNNAIEVCGSFHGATWGYSGPDTVLKRYPAK